MQRRDFLKMSASMPFLGLATQEQSSFGWLPGHYSKRSPFRDVATHLSRFGEGKVACLWKPWEQVTGREWLAHHQKGPDCVAHAAGGGMDLLTTIQIAWGEKAEKWIAKSSTDAIYSGGRLVTHSRLGAGMPGEWAVHYLKTYGNLLRQPYPPYDLTSYDIEKWSKTKLPNILLSIARKHPLIAYTPVLSWQEFRDAIAAGYPVLFTGKLGFENAKRDKEGFVKPKGSWNHAWLGAGIDDKNNRPGACLLNSFSPRWASGPKRHGQPDGSIWVDARYIHQQCHKHKDSFALSLYKGYPLPEKDYILW